MCGICGELRFDGQAVSPDTLQAMMAVLTPRGPDHGAQWINNTVGLGHRRLAIIDLSPQGQQPMQEQGISLVFNGTIYNYRALQQELIQSGHSFRSQSDTEVILKAYLQWGLDCVAHLQGMFAFVLWDESRQQLLLARDRLGIKPLYYAKTDRFIRFASTLPALLATKEINTDFDPVGLHHQFTLHAVIPAPYTLFTGIKKLEPASLHLITPRGTHQQYTYWQLHATRPERFYRVEEWLELTHNALKAAVSSHRTAADVPVGVLLSGGLDSSLLVGLLAQQQPVEELLTFSVGFEDAPEEKGSEFEYSDQVIARYPTRHHRYHIPNAQLLDRLPEAIRAMSEPMFGQDAVAFYLLSEQVSKVVKVVQSGQGADEVFAGYFWYPLMQAAQGSYLNRFSSHYFDRSHEEYLTLIDPAFQGENYTAQTVEKLLQEKHADTFLDQVLRMDVTTLIVDDPVKRVDNMTMAWGLEARVPFLDQHLVELAAMMPPQLKLQEKGKYPLKAIARQYLPSSVIDRPKGYFPVPALKYVRGTFLEWMRDTLESTTCRQRGLYQRSYVDQLLADPTAYMTALKGSKLWHLALLENWLQIHLK
jgi:asparagine synthase (glutamine-hydrolysing)